MKKVTKNELSKEDLKSVCKGYRINKKFATVMAIVSIIGFSGIISQHLFGKNIDNIVQALWFIILGFGFILESRPFLLFKRLDESLSNRNFTSVNTLIVGLMASVCGILKLLGIENIIFSAVQGFIAIIAIIFIIIETWIVKIK